MSLNFKDLKDIKMTKFDKRFYIACLIASFVVIAFSPFELMVSEFFYTKGEGFYLRETPFVSFIKSDWPLYVYALMGLCGGLWIGGKINKNSVYALKDRALIFIVLSLLVVPGIIVNGLFKGLWGRARPIQITEFGGSLDYTAPLVFAEQCTKNCSFPSGHAALAFWCVALALLLPKSVRKIGVVCAIIMGVVVSYSRVAGGFHFVSDTIFSFLMVVPWVLWLWRRMSLDK